MPHVVDLSGRAAGSQRSGVVIVCYLVLTCVLLSIPATGRFAQSGFVVASVIAGIILYRWNGPVYAQFTLWIWFTAPFVRRITDLRAGWTNPSIVLLTPYLVAAIAVFTMPSLFARRFRMFLLPSGLLVTALLAGMTVGIFRGGASEVFSALPGWLIPLIFGLYLIVKSSANPQYRPAIVRTVILAGMIMAVYGVIQFVFAPEWDRFWIQNVSPDLVDPSFGQPEPYGIRTFSTLNSPAALAAELLLALLLLTSRRTMWPALPVAVGLILTQVRMAWIGLAEGLILLALVSPMERTNRMRRRALGLLVVLVAAVITLTVIPIVRDVVADRLDTFANLGKDESLTGRLTAYSSVLAYSVANPLGIGLSQRTALGDLALDGALQQMLLSLGWIGTTCFCAGLIGVIYMLVRAPVPDAEAATLRVASIVFLLMAPAANVFQGPLGLLTWVSIGLAVAPIAISQKLHREHAERSYFIRSAPGSAGA